MSETRVRTLAVLQARTSSRRLPGKVLKPILGQPMILRQIERIEHAESLDRLVVATSEDPSDDELAAACAQAGKAVFRGALDDVLDRFYRAAEPQDPDLVVRLTGDCPLADWNVIDLVVQDCIAKGVDYASNTLTPTWPDGLDVEVMRFSALRSAWQEASTSSDREHVTPYINRHPDLFTLANVARKGEDLAGLRWTVDEPEDLEFVTRVYDALYADQPAFASEEILDLLRRRPELNEINAGIRRNEGFAAASTAK